MDGSAKGLGELPIGRGMGGGRVQRSLKVFAFGGQQQQANQIVEMNPRHPLTAAAQWASQTQPKRRQHFRQGTALLAQHDPDPRIHDADPRFGRRLGFPFPSHADLGQEIAARPRRLVQDLVAAVAVVAHSRNGNQDARRSSQSLEGRHQVTRAGHATVAYAGLLVRSPAALGDGFTGQVKNDVNAFESRGRRRIALRIPGKEFHVVAPQSCRSLRRISRQHNRMFQPR